MKVAATVIIPTFDHVDTLNYSIPTALNQTVRDIEVFVIGDGAPDSTWRIVESFAAKDPRVKWFGFPKGKRHGEAYRYEVLQQARGKIVCYLSDDDLWLPDHIEAMLKLLESADFGHCLPARVDPEGLVGAWSVDLSLPFYKQLLLGGDNRVPLSFMAHRLDFYKRLPHGWRPAPSNVPSDLYMWQQFLRAPKVRAASSADVTALNFSSSNREGMTPRQRVTKLAEWAGRLESPGFREELNEQLLGFLLKEYTRTEAEFVTARRLDHKRAVAREAEAARLRPLVSEVAGLKTELTARNTELELVYKSRAWRLRNVFRAIFPRRG